MVARTEFPVLEADQSNWSLFVIQNEMKFRYYPGIDLRRKSYDRQILYDSSGNVFKVVKARSAKSAWKVWENVGYFVGSLLGFSWLKEVEWELDFLGQVSLDEMKDVVRRYIRNDRDRWHEGVGSREMLRQVSAAETYKDLILVIFREGAPPKDESEFEGHDT